MKTIIIKTWFFLIISLLFLLFSTQAAPWRSVDFITIFLGLFFLLYEIDEVLYYAIGLSLIRDLVSHNWLGISLIIYIFTLLGIKLIRNTILTHQNQFSLILLTLFFHILYSALSLLLQMKISLFIIQESIFAIILNTSITYCLFLLTQIVYKQLKKRFIWNYQALIVDALKVR